MGATLSVGCCNCWACQPNLHVLIAQCSLNISLLNGVGWAGKPNISLKGH